jgi:hypothetical protein
MPTTNDDRFLRNGFIYAASQLTVTVTGLPIRRAAGGRGHRGGRGREPDRQLTELMFKPTAGASGQRQTFSLVCRTRAATRPPGRPPTPNARDSQNQPSRWMLSSTVMGARSPAAEVRVPAVPLGAT